MNKLIIQKKIDSMLRAMQRVEAHTPEKLDEFLSNIDSQDIITLNLTRIIQLCVDIAMHVIAESNADIPQTMSESFDTLQKLSIIDKNITEKLKKSIGFRNIAVHNYGELDLNLTHKIAKEHLSDFKEFIRQVLKTDEY